MYPRFTQLLFLSFVFSFLVQKSTAQVPGGVDTAVVGKAMWMKANSTTGLTLDASNNFVLAWKDEFSTYTVNQANTANAPNFVDDDNSVHEFNFNPYLDLETSSSRKLSNTLSTQNFVGTSGTYFMVCDAVTGNGSLMTYRSINGIRVQAKPAFRLQNGYFSIGYTSDFGPFLSGAATFGGNSARVITNRGLQGSSDVRINSRGFPVNNTSSTYYPAIQLGLCIGANTSSEYYNDGIAEVIMFPTTLSPADANKVESYLAMKYGVTLDSATGVDYTLSDNSVAWPYASHPDFHHRITSIVRDDGSGLYQKQSRTVENGLPVTAYCGAASSPFPGMNIDNTAQIDDLQYMLFGDDGLSTSLNRCTATDYQAMMERTWIVRQSSNFDTTVTLSVLKTDVAPEVTNLIVSTDPTFPIAMSTLYPLTDDGQNLYAEVLLGDSLFFTFCSDSVSTTYTVTPSYCVIPSGTASAVSTGGGGNYTYTWNTTPSQNGPNAIDLPAGNISVDIMHGNGCIVTENVAISSATYTLNVTDIVVDETCGNSNGSITIDENNSGTPSYFYSIDGGTTLSATPVFTGLSAGSYPIYVVDAYGCTNTLYSTTVNDINTPPLINYSIIEPLCHGDQTGSVIIQAVQTFPPYTYSLPGLSLTNSTGTFDNLYADTYVFKIVDSRNCHLDTAITLTEPSDLVITADLEASCWLYPTGRATLNGYGGTPGFEYGVTGEVFSTQNLMDSLAPGPHVFYIRDANGCIDSTTVNIVQFTPFEVSYVTEDIECIAWNTGLIDITVSNGVSPYTYAWREFPGQIIGNSKDDLYPGRYHIEIKDANMCTDTLSIFLDNNCCKPFVPNAFTPEGDGLNDYLEVHKSPDMDMVRFEIYDRYGEQIYYTIDQNPRWDGRYNGKDVEVGTYFWKATVICTGDQEVVTGDFHLLR